MAPVTQAATQALKALALASGFSRVGIARAHARWEDERRLRAWLEAGMHGEMQWMAKNPARRCDPNLVVEGAQCVIVLALDYDSEPSGVLGRELEGQAWISRYAWGRDYHKVAERGLKAMTREVADQVVPLLPHSWRSELSLDGQFDPQREFRWSVDYGPVLERQWAQEAGLGWQGKHSLLVDPRRGSYFFLATVITTLPLVVDKPQTDHCGSCSACVDACPTGAIVAERVVDARRCISYLTIEKRGELTDSEQIDLGDHVFGCDICQEVCPFNRFSSPSTSPDLRPAPERVAPALADLLALDSSQFEARFRGSALMRAKVEGLRRNAKAVEANQRRRNDDRSRASSRGDG